LINDFPIRRFLGQAFQIWIRTLRARISVFLTLIRVRMKETGNLDQDAKSAKKKQE